jgi:hypothetical protein
LFNGQGAIINFDGMIALARDDFTCPCSKMAQERKTSLAKKKTLNPSESVKLAFPKGMYLSLFVYGRRCLCGGDAICESQVAMSCGGDDCL